ncbi:MAG: hypothetical protein E2598_08425 [Sphingobium sp.]|nr:hypothetical protein [Sphingobium sp.]
MAENLKNKAFPRFVNIKFQKNSRTIHNKKERGLTLAPDMPKGNNEGFPPFIALAFLFPPCSARAMIGEQAIPLPNINAKLLSKTDA